MWCSPLTGVSGRTISKWCLTNAVDEWKQKREWESHVVESFSRRYLKEKGRRIHSTNTEKGEHGGALDYKAQAEVLYISSWQHPFVQLQSSKDEFWIEIKIYS